MEARNVVNAQNVELAVGDLQQSRANYHTFVGCEGRWLVEDEAKALYECMHAVLESQTCRDSAIWYSLET